MVHPPGVYLQDRRGCHGIKGPRIHILGSNLFQLALQHILQYALWYALENKVTRMDEEKVRENRVRRMAKRQGMKLMKSRRRDPLAIDYGGYMLVGIHTNTVEYGGSPYAFCASLDDVENYLMQED
jgi:hypothetical protein